MSGDVLERASKALSSLDTESLVACYACEFVFDDAASGIRIHDKEELHDYYQSLFSLPFVGFSGITFFGCGQRAAGEWTWSGRSRQSRKSFHIRGASLFWISGDRIVKEIIYYDPRAALV